MDGDTQRIADHCPVFAEGHMLNYDPGESDITKSTFSCACGYRVIEPEDCGSGA